MRLWPILLLGALVLAGCSNPNESTRDSPDDPEDGSMGDAGRREVSTRIYVADNDSRGNDSVNRTS